MSDCDEQFERLVRRALSTHDPIEDCVSLADAVVFGLAQQRLVLVRGTEGVVQAPSRAITLTLSERIARSTSIDGHDSVALVLSDRQRPLEPALKVVILDALSVGKREHCIEDIADSLARERGRGKTR